jgi:hypothetical protein
VAARSSRPPVVFRDPNKVTDEVVQLHLEHPVVQRLLQRFLSQGFVHDDLSRTCVAQSRDSVSRVVLLGRLALYGPGAARLHEEIIAVTARWTDSKIRREPLKPYERDTEATTINLLYQSLIDAQIREVPEIVSNQLREAAPQDVSQLRELAASSGTFPEDSRMVGGIIARACRREKRARENLAHNGVHQPLQARWRPCRLASPSSRSRG